MVGMTTAAQAMAAIWERFNLLRAASIEGANAMVAGARTMRSLSGLTGQMGTPSATYLEILRQTSKTFQTPEEAAK